MTCAKVSARAGGDCATMRLHHGGGRAMSKKDRKIKKLKRELKALKAELRELKSLRRRRTTVAKAKSPPPPERKPQTQSSAPERPDVDTPPLMSMALRSISAVRSAGQR